MQASSPLSDFSVSPQNANKTTRDEEVTLSPQTLAALQEFIKEKLQPHQEDASLPVMNSNSVDSFEENWQLSQFWYSKDTANSIANEALAVTLCKSEESDPKIACISTPSAFRALKTMDKQRKELYLFEFDKRFHTYGSQFVFYDYNSPREVPSKFHRTFDYMIVDPPFLSEECLTKFADTIALLARTSSTPILFLTGLVMEPILFRLFPNFKLTSFKPQHHRNLQNDFACYANYQTMTL